MIKLLNIDCMEFMATLPDKAFDLAIVDPPYGITEVSSRVNTPAKCAGIKTIYNDALWKQEKPTDDYFLELIRVSKNQIIWGGNYFIENLKNTRHYIIWDKETQDSNFADCEMAWTSFDRSAKIFKFAWNGMIQGDMKNKEQRIHPTQKPVKLYEWLLTNYAKTGDRILDTHGGSMSIAIACHNLGYDLTLCELNLDYYKAGVERFNKHTAQARMFTEPAEQVEFEQIVMPT